MSCKLEVAKREVQKVLAKAKNVKVREYYSEIANMLDEIAASKQKPVEVVGYKNLSKADQRWMEKYDEDSKNLKKFTTRTQAKRARLLEEAKKPRQLKETQAQKLQRAKVENQVGVSEDEAQLIREQIMTKSSDPLDAEAELYGNMTEEDIIQLEQEYEAATKLGSEADKNIDWESFQKVEAKIDNDATAMAELQAVLVELDKSKDKLSKDHAKHLQEIIDTFVSNHSQFLNEMDVYMTDEVENNVGLAAIDEGKMYFGIGMNPGLTSMSEIYAHEVVHAATGHALENKTREVAATVLRLNELYRKASKEVKPEHLEVQDMESTPEQVKARAEEKWNYIFDNKDGKGLHEFIAHGLTNEQLVARLKEIEIYTAEKEKPTTLFETLMKHFHELIDWVFSTVRHEEGIKGDQLLLKLAVELGQANNKAIAEGKKGMTDKVWEGIDAINDYAAKKLEGVKDKLSEEPTEHGEGKLGNAAWIAKNIIPSLTNPDKREAFFNVMSHFGHKPWGSMQQLLRSLTEEEPFEKMVGRLVLKANNIDNAKMGEEQAKLDVLNAAFKEKTTDIEKRALGKVLMETDLHVLMDDYSMAEIVELLKDKKKLDAAISKVSGELVGKDSVWYDNQAELLGRYMATGIGAINLRRNANNINQKVDTDTAFKGVREENLSTIDKLATLYSMTYLPPLSVETAIPVLEREVENGMPAMLMMHKAFVEGADKKLGLHIKRKTKSGVVYETKVSNATKGYVKESYNSEIDMRIGYVTDEEQMAQEGYKLQKKLGKDSGDTSKGERAIYISNDPTTQRYDAGAMRIIDSRHKGTTISAAHWMNGGSNKKAREDISNIRKRAKLLDKAMEAKKVDVSKAGGPTPLYNGMGRMVDFRYEMSKADRLEYLDRDNNAFKMMAQMYATAEDKVQSKERNMALVEVLLEDQKKTISEERRTLAPDAMLDGKPDTNAREAWKLLPDYVKNYIYEQTGKKEIAVRGSLYHVVFGSRRLTAGDAWLVNKSPMVSYWVKFVEKVWQDIIQHFKLDTVIKNPATLFGNVTSNIIMALILRTNPVQLAKDYVNGYRLIREHKVLTKKYRKLEAEVEAGLSNDTRGLARIKEQIERNPINRLMEEGLFQTIVEDVEMSEVQHKSALDRQLHDAAERFPKFMRTGGQWLYMTKNNPVFKGLMMATQYSDLIGRYSLYNTLNQRYSKKGMDKKLADKKAMDLTISAFINYELQDTPAINYANKMGFAMYTKFYQRIQRVLATIAQDSPVNTVAAIGLQGVLDIDVDDVFDYSVFTHGMPAGGPTAIADAMVELTKPSMVQLFTNKL